VHILACKIVAPYSGAKQVLYVWLCGLILWERSICHCTKCCQAPRIFSNPDELSLPLKYLLAIKTNPSILILAYPKWSILLTAIFTTDVTSICGYPHTLTHYISLSLRCLAHSPLLSFSYKYDDCVCFLIINILTINICGQSVVLLGDLLTIVL
jgi:hypothetical protein